MENTVISFKNMLLVSTVKDPRSAWTMLGSDKWVYDLGLKKHLNTETGRMGDYLFENKRHKKLWDLIIYAGEDVAFLIIQYYDFPKPAHFSGFLKWVYNHVASDNNWKCPKNSDQMDLFPYNVLWTTYVNLMGDLLNEE